MWIRLYLNISNNDRKALLGYPTLRYIDLFMQYNINIYISYIANA